MRTGRFWLVGPGVVAILAATVAAFPSLLEPLFPRRHPLTDLPTAAVRRTDLSVALTAGGQVESSEQTVIECELERLDVSVRGNGMSAGGASTILSVVPDGSTVKQGDVLCVLDASDYEELLRTQRMNVDRAEADHRQAELNLEVARTAVNEYRDGLMLQNLKTMEGQIALAESDYERIRDRLEWTRRMLAKGYLPRSQLTAEEFQATRLAVNLTNSKTRLRMLRDYSGPIYLRILGSDIKAAEAVLSFQDRRLRRNHERLDYLKRQVERCTIRAPHDGFVIYANQAMHDVRIEPGLVVRQKQRLFYLPDLAKMEVATLLHETVVKDVRPGMRARVKVEGLSGRGLEGHVVSVSQLPMQNMFSEIKYFVGVVKLDTIPRGLRPGMSAEVAIQTVRRPDVLTVPTEAVTVEKGQDVCYVARLDHVERREVKVGQATRDLLEVTAGLDEGEPVVLDPAHLDGSVAVSEAPPAAPTDPAPEHPALGEVGSLTE